MTEVTSVDHIIIAVRDLKEAEKNYTAIFGRAPSWKGVHPGVGTGNVLYRLANTYVELYAPVAEGANAEALKAHLDAHGEGLYGIVLGVDDAAAATAAFNARGLKSGTPVDGKGRDEITGARLLDPQTVPLDIAITRIWSVGNYALGLAFGDGHDTGIYTLASLRAMQSAEMEDV